MLVSLFAAMMMQGGIARPDPAHVGVQATIDSLESAQLRFYYEWRELAKVSADYRQTLGNAWRRTPKQQAAGGIRSGFIQCAPGTESIWMTAVPPGHGIKYPSSWLWVCPSWQLSDSVSYSDWRNPDGALDAQFVAPVRTARSALARKFEVAARATPANDWIVGQWVRLLLDQQDYAGALAAARICTPIRAWCHQLVGLALAWGGNVVAADSAFASAANAMDPAEKCRWTDVSLLMESADATSYSRVACTKRDSANAVFWWLSDPMYLDAGNERRVEHFSRLVSASLKAALAIDERLDWRRNVGGDAHRELIARYGWPAYIWPLWNYHIGHMGCPVYSCESGLATYEYTVGRLHTVPSSAALASPFESRSTDWVITDPKPPPLKVESTNSFVTRAYVEAVAKISTWWPREHFAPRLPIVQIPDGQTAFLRREQGAIFAAAIDLDPERLGRAPGQPINATLILSPQPDSVVRVASGTAAIGGTVVMFGAIPSRPGIGAIEYPAAGSDAPGGRTRFGISPPQPLSAMAAGEIAVSDVVLLQPPTGSAALPNETNAALQRMQGSSSVDRGSRIGVYWETYGIAPTDTVEIAVWIERHTPQGILRRFGTALNVATDINTPVVMSWRESSLGPNASIIPGRVPIVSRSIVLDASKLRAGDYWLDVVVRKAGQEPARSRRAFTIPNR